MQVARDIVMVPPHAGHPPAWYAGLPVDPGDFAGQLNQLRTSLDRANSALTPTLERQTTTVSS